MVNEECELKWESGSMASSVVLRGGGGGKASMNAP